MPIDRNNNILRDNKLRNSTVKRARNDKNKLCSSSHHIKRLHVIRLVQRRRTAMRALLWLCSLSGINAFVTTPSITRSVSSFSASRLLVHTLHPEIPNPENERFAKDIETVVKKLRPWSRDPTMKGKRTETGEFALFVCDRYQIYYTLYWSTSLALTDSLFRFLCIRTTFTQPPFDVGN